MLCLLHLALPVATKLEGRGTLRTMAISERVMIYATGSDMDLRRMCWEMLEAKLITKADMLDRAEIYLKGGTKRKFSSSGRAVTMFCDRESLDEVMKKMHSAYASDDLEAFALPILAHL